MKANKKVILTTATVLGAAALVAGGTIAYFTDIEEKTNSFTIGNVDVTIYESQLHRQNSGRTGIFPALASDAHYCDWNYERTAENQIDDNTGAGPQPDTQQNGGYASAAYCTPGINANNTTGISAITYGHTAANRTWGYSDATIIADAATYKANDGYFTTASQNIVPGQFVRKFTYVKNESESSDAYVLIKYKVPTQYAQYIEVKVPHTPYGDSGDNNFAYFTALTKNATTNKYEATTYGTSYTEGDYTVYAAVTNAALKPGEMTYWSPVNTVRLKTNVSNNSFDYTQGNPIVDIKVEAQAIQAKTFSNAIDAINAL